MNIKKVMIMAIALMMMLLSSVSAFAATVQPKAEVETTAVPANTKANKLYPKSMQKTVLESAKSGKEFGKAEVKRIQNEIATLKENRVAVDEIGVAWKSGEGQYVEKVRVTSGNIHFEWTPSYIGYTWMSDLSMWSDSKLPGSEALLEFLDKDGKVLWSTTVVFKKELKVPEVNTGKEEIVPPCPNMAPTSAAKEAVEVGIAPGENNKK
jgi:hypothetical protein